LCCSAGIEIILAGIDTEVFVLFDQIKALSNGILAKSFSLTSLTDERREREREPVGGFSMRFLHKKNR
jgi:hypothetical protein